MTDLYLDLADRIRGEIEDAGAVVERAERAWIRLCSAGEDQEFYLDSVALNLHGFYSALERVFELVATRVDGAGPSGEAWHRKLVQQISRDLPGIRPAMISSRTADMLDEYRRFRHLIRNVYATNLRPDRVEVLIRRLDVLWPAVKAELGAFADFLEALANPLDR